jgi:hypothetical protein
MGHQRLPGRGIETGTEPSMFDALALRREGVPTQAMTKAIRSGTGAR